MGSVPVAGWMFKVTTGKELDQVQANRHFDQVGP
jgi:hypothetical protein